MRRRQRRAPHSRFLVVTTLFLCIYFFFSQPNRDGLPELVAGGLSYCLGMVFFKSDGRIPFAHAIWHLFVAIGAGIHYYAIWRYLYRPSTLEAKRPR